jgi:hypothetical protein
LVRSYIKPDLDDEWFKLPETIYVKHLPHKWDEAFTITGCFVGSFPAKIVASDKE